jgi:hypothetical protein
VFFFCSYSQASWAIVDYSMQEEFNERMHLRLKPTQISLNGQMPRFHAKFRSTQFVDFGDSIHMEADLVWRIGYIGVLEIMLGLHT